MSRKKLKRMGSVAMKEPVPVEVVPSSGSGKRPAWLAPAVLVLLVGAINFITMPSMFYPGDNFAIRMELSDWFMTGSLGIDYSRRQELQGFTDVRGQYFYENDTRQKFFSKYGFGCTLAYLPAYAWQKWAVGGDLNRPSDSLLFKINVWQVVLSMIFAFYVFRTARLFTSSDWTASAFVLLSIYCTFAWYYLRAPTIEVLQMVPFAASTYHALAFARGKIKAAAPDQPGEETRPGAPLKPWFHLASACLWAGLLVLIKLIFLLHAAVIVVAAVLSGNKRGWLPATIISDVRRNFARYVLFMLVPLSLLAVVVLWSNWYRFESVFNTGYGQWMSSPGVKHDNLSLKILPSNLKGMFLTFNEYNVLTTFPVLVFALPGFRAFLRRHSAESAILIAVILANLIPNAMYSCWPGPWCYGPRYQLPMLFVAALPFVCVLEWTVRRIRTVSGISAATFMAGVLAFSLYLQVLICSVHYFAVEYLGGFFGQFKHERIDSALKEMSNPVHKGVFYMDLNAYLSGRRPHLLTERLRSLVPPDKWPGLKAQVDAQLKQFMRPNYYFFD